jgi:dimethylaniline monooxygenase (N-oxide forming)
MVKVCVIGAGACGLVALKECLENGLDAVALELGTDIGGVFAHYQPHYNLTITNHMMAYSDFPFHKPLMYSFLKDYHDYLKLYAEKFGLMKKIEFNSSVETVKMDPVTEKWSVLVEKRDKVTGLVTTETRVFDAVIVASGAHLKKNIPDLTGFTGEVIHSQEWNEKKMAIHEKKHRVMIIGTGESSADVIENSSKLAAKTTVWSRRKPLMAPRFIAPGLMEKDCSTGKVYPLCYYLESATTSRGFQALTYYQNHFLKWMIYKFFWPLDKSKSAMREWVLDQTNNEPWRGEYCQFSTKNCKLGECAAAGTVDLVVADKVSYSGKTVKFSNGKSLDVDTIVLCTGFQTTFPFLDGIDVSQVPRDMWKHSIPAKYGRKGLFFVGFARPHQGGIPACGEMHSRYIALLLAGKKTLPSNYEEMIKIEAAAEDNLYINSPNLKTLVDYPSLMENMAQLIGCVPRIPFLVTLCGYLSTASLAGAGLLFADVFLKPEVAALLPAQAAAVAGPLLVKDNAATLLAMSALFFAAQFAVHDGFLIKYLFFPAWGCWYRLNGPGANPAAVKAVLDNFPLTKFYGQGIFNPLSLGVVCLYPFAKVYTTLGGLVRTLTGGASWTGAYQWGTPGFLKLHGNKVPQW